MNSTLLKYMSNNNMRLSLGIEQLLSPVPSAAYRHNRRQQTKASLAILRCQACTLQLLLLCSVYTKRIVSEYTLYVVVLLLLLGNWQRQFLCVTNIKKNTCNPDCYQNIRRFKTSEAKNFQYHLLSLISGNFFSKNCCLRSSRLITFSTALSIVT